MAMTDEKIRLQQEQLLQKASSGRDTPFDYIIVGSGAAGGPLAARLTEGGKRVLVLEAGIDPVEEGHLTCEAYKIPAYHGAATEDRRMSWGFSVRHFADDGRQKKDSKYDPAHDPSVQGDQGKGGIFYPRASGLGGCTTHHAMIVVRPNDRDWNRIAARTGDSSWRAENMQGYFGRIEDCLYYDSFEGFIGKLLFSYKWWKRFTAFVNPTSQLDRGGHGRRGWQKTSFIDPMLVRRIAKGDRTFLSVLYGVILFLVRQKGRLRFLLRSLRMVRFVQFLDPNFGTQRSSLHAQLSFIPIGTDGKQRTGVRERLLKVAQENPVGLVLRTQTLITRVIFEKSDGQVPRAIGVEAIEGIGLYEASSINGQARRTLCYFAKEEVILAAGAFNSPQLLMLSGIGETEHLNAAGVGGLLDCDGNVIAPIIPLSGVGRNLQDRYEVSIVSETKQPFSTLNDASFAPGDLKDAARAQWYRDGTGLYSTNGGSLAFFLATSHALRDGAGEADPDLFIFGAPAAFRGYYWNWSRELLRRTKGARDEQRNLWSWVILKAYTKNGTGTVQLRDKNPRRQPDICFNSFSPSSQIDSDLEALSEGIAFVRKLNGEVAQFAEEIQPGNALEDNSSNLKEWIKNEAWGHHACGTCRMGSDSWQIDVNKLHDKGAVLDSEFRVHGVDGLRVVDASVFPEIPGYFIATPIFMIGEKAADLLLASFALRYPYPQRFESAEAQAVIRRRAAAAHGTSNDPSEDATVGTALPPDTVGLALSGGGIRSATLCLGVLQALAKRDRIRGIDILATVSGGGYVGAFLGRLFTRVAEGVADPVGRVQRIISCLSSNEIWWLRRHANYLRGEGRSDIEVNLGAIWRNLLAVHLCIGTMFIAGFGVLRLLTDMTWLGIFGVDLLNIPLTPWWWLPLGVFVLGLFPAWFAFWLAPKPGATAAHPLFSLGAWLILLAAAVAATTLRSADLLAGLALTSLLLAWVWQELARLKSVPSGASEQYRGVLIRNRLTRGLGLMLTLEVLSLLWVALDTFARLAAQNRLMMPLVSTMLGLATIMPLLRFAVMKLSGENSLGDGLTRLRRRALAAGFAFPLIVFIFFGYDVIAHTAFGASLQIGLWTTLLTLSIALVLGRASGFLNLSSLNSLYAARLARTFLGASSEARVNVSHGDKPPGVVVAHPDDDIFFYKYHPEQTGGPLHLISVFINETVEARSGRSIDEDRGMPLCVGPIGASVGLRFHALWEKEGPRVAGLEEKMLRVFEDADPERRDYKTALCPLPAAPDPNEFHVFARDPLRFDEPCIAPEQLRLSQWIAISGAAFTAGAGRRTSLAVSLLLGLFNLRLGYWWDSGVNANERPGRYPPSLLRRLKSVPSALFRTQTTLLNEWRRYFKGPGYRLWYLSDGGHIENCALYELIRRRVGFMIMVDATHDPEYVFDDLGAMVRRARLDFGAQFSWVDPSKGAPAMPNWIENWLDVQAIGSLYAMKRDGPQAAALARITYENDRSKESWLLVLKGCLIDEDVPLDVRNYSIANPSFPNQSTFDQFFSDDQWESYRLLGEQIGLRVFR